MGEPDEALPPAEVVPAETAITFMQAKLAEWDFKVATAEDNAQFLTQFAHWALEAFGQQDSHGQWFLYPSAPYTEGFDHEELPFDLQQIVMTEHYGEVYVGNENSLRMKSAPLVLEEDPFIPCWEEIDQLPTFAQQLEAITSDPGILGGITPSSFEVVPGIDLSFSPAWHFKWGLQYLAQSRDVRLIPYGEYSHTQVPFQYATERLGDPLQVALTLADLVVLCVRHAHKRATVELSMLDVLTYRLEGKANIPLNKLTLSPKPGNSVKNLLIQRALSSKTG